MKIHSSIFILVMVFSYQSSSLQGAQREGKNVQLESWQINNLLEIKIQAVLNKEKSAIKEPKDHEKDLKDFLEEYGNQITRFGACSHHTHDLEEMSDDIVSLVNQHCDLEKITLTYCNAVSANTLEALIKKQTKLKELCLTHMPCITSELITTILQSCPSLTTLALVGCKSITNEHLQYISSNLEKLEHLVLLESSGWSKRTMQSLRRERPELNIYSSFFECLWSWCCCC